MNVRKFIAATARDALHKVKEMLGPDAIILSNRNIPGGVEIMAVSAKDMALIAPDLPPRQAEPHSGDDFSVSLSAAASGRPAAHSAVPPLAPRPAPKFEREAQHRAQRVSAAEVVPAEVMDEVRALRKIVEQHLVSTAWSESARSEPAKTEVLRQLLDAGFSPSLARDLLTGLPRELDVARARIWARKAADRSLQTLSAETDIVDQGGVYALVGPTGVGKTTTTAKLAARCVLRHGAQKVALVTTDGYRIGAHEQLRIYGRILGVSVHLVKDAADLRQTLNDLQHKHMVLIDTMGMSQRDRMVREQVEMFEGCAVRRLLLLSATARGDTLDDVVRAYHSPDMAGCILSKIDEAASLASSLDVIIRQGLNLHYVSNGQRVPEDLHLPNRAYLLHRAFKDVPEASPHRLAGDEPVLMMANAGAAKLAVGGARG